jgi:hypothetical protein
MDELNDEYENINVHDKQCQDNCPKNHGLTIFMTSNDT